MAQPEFPDLWTAEEKLEAQRDAVEEVIMQDGTAVLDNDALVRTAIAVTEPNLAVEAWFNSTALALMEDYDISYEEAKRLLLETAIEGRRHMKASEEQ